MNPFIEHEAILLCMTLLEPGYKVYVYSQSGAVDFIFCYYKIVAILIRVF